MDIADRLRQLAAALPSDSSAVTLTRADIVDMLEGATESDGEHRPARDMTVQQVAEHVQRSPSTVRRWLGNGELRGYKLMDRDWRVPRSAVRDFLESQTGERDEAPADDGPEVDIGAWRTVRDRSGLRSPVRAARIT